MKNLILIITLFLIILSNYSRSFSQEIINGMEYGSSKKVAKKTIKNNKEHYTIQLINLSLRAKTCIGNNDSLQIIAFFQTLTFDNLHVSGIQRTEIAKQDIIDFLTQQGYNIYLDHKIKIGLLGKGTALIMTKKERVAVFNYSFFQDTYTYGLYLTIKNVDSTIFKKALYINKPNFNNIPTPTHASNLF